MPANHLTDRDYELLSAYIDDQLSATERARIERRLQSDILWQQEYEALRTTTQLVRDLPVLKAPRNFTLTPQMAQAARRITPFPKQRRKNHTPWAILVAAVFVLIIGGAILFAQRSAPQMGSENTQQAVAAASTSLPTPAETPLVFAPPLPTPVMPTNMAATGVAIASPMPTPTSAQPVVRSNTTAMPPAPSDMGDATANTMADMAQTTIREAESTNGETGDIEALDDVSTFAIPQQTLAADVPTEGAEVQAQSVPDTGVGGAGLVPDEDTTAEESAEEPRFDRNTLGPTTFVRALLNLLISLFTQVLRLR